MYGLTFLYTDQLYFPQPHPAGAVLDYTVDWTPWLTQQSDVLSTAGFAIAPVLTLSPYGVADPDDCTVVPTVPPFTAGLASCWVSGGLAGRTYRLTCTVTTLFGRTTSRAVILLCAP